MDLETSSIFLRTLLSRGEILCSPVLGADAVPASMTGAVVSSVQDETPRGRRECFGGLSDVGRGRRRWASGSAQMFTAPTFRFA